MIYDVEYKNLNERELRAILEDLLIEADNLLDEISNSDFPLYEKGKVFYNKVNKIRHYVSLERNKTGVDPFYNNCFMPTIIDSCRGYPRKHNKTLIFSAINDISFGIKHRLKYQ